MSSERTSRFIGPTLKWLIPTISPEAIALTQWVVRKLGHVVEYAILAALCWRALQHSPSSTPRAGGRRSLLRDPAAQIAWLIAVLYASTDEWHQSLVQSRMGTPWDVVIDALGALVGIMTIRWWAQRASRGNQ